MTQWYSFKAAPDNKSCSVTGFFVLFCFLWVSPGADYSWVRAWPYRSASSPCCVGNFTVFFLKKKPHLLQLVVCAPVSDKL